MTNIYRITYHTLECTLSRFSKSEKIQVYHGFVIKNIHIMYDDIDDDYHSKKIILYNTPRELLIKMRINKIDSYELHIAHLVFTLPPY